MRQGKARSFVVVMASLSFAACGAACGSNVEPSSTGTSGNTGGAGTSSASSSSSSSGGAGGATTSSSTSSSTSSTSSTASTSTSTGGGPDLIAELKAGPWLFGVAAGLDHFSWVRFDFVNATQGSVMVLSSKCTSCTGFWGCEGQGLFSADPQSSSLILQLPQGCNNAGHTLVFKSFGPPMLFPSATIEAMVTDDGNGIQGFRFPPDHCDAAFKTCANPYQ